MWESNFNQVIKYFLNKCSKFHFSSKILNAAGEKIMFLSNFRHLFSVLFYVWNTSINAIFQFFRFIFKESLSGMWLHFSMKGGYFPVGGELQFYVRGSPRERASVLMGPGVQKKKKMGWEGTPSCYVTYNICLHYS